MKKTYQKPEIYTEDVSIAFAQNCCQGVETPEGFNSYFGLACQQMCRITVVYPYIKCN